MQFFRSIFLKMFPIFVEFLTHLLDLTNGQGSRLFGIGVYYDNPFSYYQYYLDLPTAKSSLEGKQFEMLQADENTNREAYNGQILIRKPYLNHWNSVMSKPPAINS